MDLKRIHLIISGRVQGVGFRFFCQQQAERLGLSGYARNRDDATVEVEVQGAMDALEDFVIALNTGPRSARVTNIEREDRSSVPNETDFTAW